MKRPRNRWLLPAITAVCAVSGLFAGGAEAACCYFSAKDQDVQQPGQKVFITWDPENDEESFTVQPKFTGNARDFGMVIPTPARPKLDEMPRDFFKEMAVFTILKRREQPASRFGFGFGGGFGGIGGLGGGFGGFAGGFQGGMGGGNWRKPAITVVEEGVVGSLDYKVIEAGRADDLYKWLKDHRYSYRGDEATLNFYVKKQWLFTVMKIDTMQMKKKKDGTFAGEVTPTRFKFSTEKLVYPLKITQLSVKDKTEALFYVQAPHKVDLPGDLTYQYQWVPMLQNARGWYAKGTFGSDKLPGKGDRWLKSIRNEIADLKTSGEELGFWFENNTRPEPNKKGQIATTLEWAKRLTAADIRLLSGGAPFTEKVPDVDQGFTRAQVNDPRIGRAVRRVIERRLAWCKKQRPGGYLVREAPAADVRQLKILTGHLREAQFLTKFRKTFTKAEMDDDLLIISAKLGQAQDESEYEEILPTSPP